MSGKNGNSVYERLTPQRKQIVDMILANLENGAGIWKRGWRCAGVPENAITGKGYRGVNYLYLFLVAMKRGYKDNRWLTFNQMKARDWTFKTDETGKSLGRKAGVSVEYFDLWDRKTHKKFDRAVLDGMETEERQTYIDENVYPIRRYYTVFNADLVDGIPAKEQTVLDETAKSERAERLLKYWNENESKIVYGGAQAYYSKATDEIHLPEREDFYNMQEFYATALHEMGHSTGNEKRLNRDLSGAFGSSKYAMEELRAEIASVFLEQDFGIEVNENSIRNNSAYIKSWHDAIHDDPNVLFTAIADAEKITTYIKQKEPLVNENAEQPAEEEKSEVYMLPSAAAALAANAAKEKRESIMKTRGKDSLLRMDDREIIERAERSKGGEKFTQLYNGISVTGNEEKDERSLMTRFAMYSNDPEQIMRLFKSSAQYRDEKPNAHYARLCNESLEFVEKMRAKMLAASMSEGKTTHIGVNAKT